MPEADHWKPRDTVRWIMEYGLVNGFLPSEIAAIQRLCHFVEQHDNPDPMAGKHSWEQMIHDE